MIVTDYIETALDNNIDPDYLNTMSINHVNTHVLNDHTYETYAVTLIHKFDDDTSVVELFIVTIDQTDMSTTSVERFHMSHHRN